jgi:uncharacterized tellurite resistance protein B-like protein
MSEWELEVTETVSELEDVIQPGKADGQDVDCCFVMLMIVLVVDVAVVAAETVALRHCLQEDFLCQHLHVQTVHQIALERLVAKPKQISE